MPEIVDAFPGKFAWRKVRICWFFLWLGIRDGAAERGVHPWRHAPRAIVLFLRIMRMWRSGVDLNEALRVERERMLHA